MVSYEILTKNGFSEKESRVYLACLALGPTTVLEISRKAELSRGSCYDLLEEMTEKGYVSKHHAAKHIVFSPLDPDMLLKRTEDSVRQLELALPELKGLFHKHARPRVRYFEGLEGVKQVYLDTLTATTEILNYANSREIRLHWPNYDDEYVAERFRKNIFLKGIAPDDEWGQAVQRDDAKCLRETRLLSAQDFQFTNEISIYDNKVAITSFQNEMIGILIESDAIADTQRDIFKMAWGFAQMHLKKPAGYRAGEVIRKFNVQRPIESAPRLLFPEG